MYALYNLFYVFFIFNIVIIGLYRYDYLLKINKILDTIYYRIMGNHVTIGTSFLVEKLLKNKNLCKTDSFLTPLRINNIGIISKYLIIPLIIYVLYCVFFLVD